MSETAARNYDPARRIFLKKVAYTAPTIITMAAAASIASAASGRVRKIRPKISSTFS